MSVISQAQQAAYLHGYLDGLREYAWRRDGVEYVGCGAETLSEATERARREFAVEGAAEGRHAEKFGLHSVSLTREPGDFPIKETTEEISAAAEESQKGKDCLPDK